MPLEGAELADYCQGSAGLCDQVNSDCSKCRYSYLAEPARRRKEEGKPLRSREEKSNAD